MMKKILFCITGVLMAGAMCAQTVPVTAVKNFEAQHQQASVLDPVLAQRGVTMPAPARAGSDASDYVTTQPEGVLKTYSRAGEKLTSVMGGIVNGTQNDQSMKIVFAPDGKTVWFDKIISATSTTFGWIKGEREGNKITVKEGQKAWYYKQDTVYTAYTVTRIVPNPDGSAENYNNYKYAPGDITFSIDKDSVITLLPDENGVAAIGLTRDSNDPFLVQYGYNGKWLGYGDINTVYTPYTVNLPQGPDSTVKLEDYSMTYFNEIGGPRVGRMVKCAVVDNKMYIQGASQYIPEAWLVGDIDGNKVTFTEQQAGLLDYYYTDFRGAEVVQRDSEYYYSPIEKLVFNYNPETKTLTTDNSLVVGTKSFLVAEGYMNVEFAPFADVAMKPATPVVGEAYYETMQGYVVSVYVPCLDVKGSFLDPSKLTYSLYVDGALYTFDADKYYIEHSATEVPYGYSDGYFFKPLNMNRYSVEIFSSNASTIGVKSIYRGGDTTTESDMATFTIPLTGVSEVKTSDVVKTQYYDLTGRCSDHPVQGVNIVVRTHSDGTTSTAKVVR